ncbi:hypothetical protein B0H16DRAFT_1446297 [Mycena metata]|uniref:Uncharacterized protein n=1 Tax=Mycena metata TaxID=1033252 RepID=A0AAD7P3F2_9AGAR|nr:hypothetical protein B0H16DRAFT_1446297 [Mycena metata]
MLLEWNQYLCNELERSKKVKKCDASEGSPQVPRVEFEAVERPCALEELKNVKAAGDPPIVKESKGGTAWNAPSRAARKSRHQNFAVALPAVGGATRTNHPRCEAKHQRLAAPAGGHMDSDGIRVPGRRDGEVGAQEYKGNIARQMLLCCEMCFVQCEAVHQRLRASGRAVTYVFLLVGAIFRETGQTDGVTCEIVFVREALMPSA